MYRSRVRLTVLFIVVFLVDVVGGYRLWNSGWPKRISLTSDQTGIERVHVVPIPFIGFDWFILVLVIGAHGLLCYLLWKAWHSSPVRE